MIGRIFDSGDYSKSFEQRRKESKDGYVTVYRVGQVDNTGEFGIFFTFDTGYYEKSRTGYDKKNAVEYVLDLNSNIWNPIKELNLQVETWWNIIGLTSDFEKYGIEDEADYDIDEKWSVTSTEGLAYTGKCMGYQAVYLEGIPNDGGWGGKFDEIAVFDKSIIERI